MNCFGMSKEAEENSMKTDYHIHTEFSCDSEAKMEELLIWETLNFLKGKTKHYDFEGSMIKGVALTNQSYGATAVPYHCISKSNSMLMSAWKTYQEYKNQKNIEKTSLK